MRFALFCLIWLAALPAHAQVEARATALQNGCKPLKIEVLQQNVGSVGETTYAITCENKGPSAAGAEAKTIKVRCRNRQCVTLD